VTEPYVRCGVCEVVQLEHYTSLNRGIAPEEVQEIRSSSAASSEAKGRLVADLGWQFPIKTRELPGPSLNEKPINIYL